MSMTKRGFIRVLGGGAVFAAGAAWAVPRLDAMPEAAIAGWKGPSSDECDTRRRALAWAMLAPNPHNMQPWLVDLSELEFVTLHVDRTRLLPQTDPFGRQITIGHGAFLELLSIAASADGYRAEIAPFPLGTEAGQPVARVHFVRDASLKTDALFAQIPKRRTTRIAFDGRPPSAEHIAALRAISDMPLTIAIEPARVEALRKLAIAGSEFEMSIPRTHKESIDVVRLGAEEIARHRDGISLTGPMMWALRQAGVMTHDKAMTPGTLAWNGGRDYALRGYASAAGFGWFSTDGNTRAIQIAAGRAYARLNLKATELDVAMQPHSQTLQEYPEMAALFADMRRETATGEGRTLQMFFRLGYAGDAGPSPRRPLDAIVMKA
ncbi:MAG: twin-arginine translocation pathway signal protein [Alphaproteobacteria bacterium]|nr:twin-arginine translocation pathway signal protein [Alphaproteobacteria bacterium]